MTNDKVDDRDERRAGSAVRADGRDDVDLMDVTTGDDECNVLRDLQNIDISDIDRQKTEYLIWRQPEASKEFKLAECSDVALENLGEQANDGDASLSVRNGFLYPRADYAWQPTRDGYVLGFPAVQERETMWDSHRTPWYGHQNVLSEDATEETCTAWVSGDDALDETAARTGTERSRNKFIAQQQPTCLTRVMNVIKQWQARRRHADVISEEAVTADLTVISVTDPYFPQSRGKDSPWQILSSTHERAVDKRRHSPLGG